MDQVQSMRALFDTLRRELENKSLEFPAVITSQSADLTKVVCTYQDVDPITSASLPVSVTAVLATAGPWRCSVQAGDSVLLVLPKGDRTQLPTAFVRDISGLPLGHFADATKTNSALASMVSTFNLHTHPETGGTTSPPTTPMSSVSDVANLYVKVRQ